VHALGQEARLNQALPSPTGEIRRMEQGRGHPTANNEAPQDFPSSQLYFFGITAGEQAAKRDTVTFCLKDAPEGASGNNY